MAATKYQVLYRYMNPNSNQFVTNDADKEYEYFFDLYHDKHKMVIGSNEEKLEANNALTQAIIEGNNTANDNYQMLFKFAGTKRVNKNVWIDKSIGYVIRDKEPIRDLITRAVDGDYSGQYLLMEGDTIENGVVVARKNLSNKILVCDSSTVAENGTHFISEELKNLITNSTIYKLTSTDLSIYKKKNNKTPLNSKRVNGSIQYSNYVYTGPVFIDEEPIARSGNANSVSKSVLNEINSCATIEIEPKDIETYEIPAHYEEESDYPYVIRDTYKRIEQSPWFLLSTHSSLQSALEKAKSVVNAIGLENLKVIKVVPTEQLIKVN